MPREHGRRRIRSARAVCRRPAKRNAPSGSPTVFPIFSDAIAILYIGRKTLVVGSGHSAANALLELAALAEIDPRTSLFWATRSSNLARIFSGGDADQLPARGELGADVRALVDSGRVSLITGFAVVALYETSAGAVVEGATANGLRRIGPVDRIIAATGQRPDLAMTRELRLDLDPWLESAEGSWPLD